MKPLWKMLRPLMLMTAVLVLASGIARADSKADMIALMDKLANGGTAAESLIDWDNFTCTAPQLKGMDLHKMYTTSNDAGKKSFRTGFINGFSTSFKKAAGGHTFAEAAKTKTDKLQFIGKEPTPGMKLKQPKGTMTLSFVRKSSKLLLQKVVITE